MMQVRRNSQGIAVNGLKVRADSNGFAGGGGRIAAIPFSLVT